MIVSCPSCCPPTGTEGWINSSYDDISHCRAVAARLQLLQVTELPPRGAWIASPLIISVLKVLWHLFWCWEGTDRCLSCDQRVGCLRKVRSGTTAKLRGRGYSNWCLRSARVVIFLVFCEGDHSPSVKYWTITIVIFAVLFSLTQMIANTPNLSFSYSRKHA